MEMKPSLMGKSSSDSQRVPRLAYNSEHKCSTYEQDPVALTPLSL